MAPIFKGYRPRIARQMAAGDAEIMRWLGAAIFAKASTGHWLAWREDEAGKVAVMPPAHPEGQPCYWLEEWSRDSTIKQVIATVESGDFDRMPESVMNLFIENPVTGKWE